MLGKSRRMVGWETVLNPSGGFLGAVLNWYGAKDCDLNIEIQQGRLSFKIGEIYGDPRMVSYPSSCTKAIAIFGLGLSLLAVANPGSARAADSDQCTVCGNLLGANVYLKEDKLTSEKRHICDQCIVLPSCFVCGLPVKTGLAGAAELPDGRVICARDAKTAILQEDEGVRVCHKVRDELDRVFVRFLTIPDTNVTIEIVDRVHLQELFKLAGNDYDCPNIWGYTQSGTNVDRLEHHISLMSGLPLSWFQATCAHEYTHAWLNEHLSTKRKQTLRREAEEAFCELLSYRLMDFHHDEAQKALILRNTYTRGQIQLFVQADAQYGFNEVLDWIKDGADGLLTGDDLGRLRKLEAQETSSVAPAPVNRGQAPPPLTALNTLVLRAIFWDAQRPMAVINDRTFRPGDEDQVRLAQTNITVRCLAIRPEAVRIRLVGSGEERELSLKAPRKL